MRIEQVLKGNKVKFEELKLGRTFTLEHSEVVLIKTSIGANATNLESGYIHMIKPKDSIIEVDSLRLVLR